MYRAEHVSGVERERRAPSEDSAPLAQPKMPFGMGGAREGLAGAQHPQGKPKHPHKKK